MSDSYKRYEAIRNAKHYNDSIVSREANVSRSCIADWKAGRSVPKTEKMARIASFLECTLSDILDVEYIPPIPASNLPAESSVLLSYYAQLSEKNRKILIDMARNMVERANIISEYEGN